jgi:hypothetical protein
MTKEEFLEAFDSKQRDFEMFTNAGNKKAQSITRQAIKKIFGAKRITKEELTDFIGKKIAQAYKNEKTSEILDSEPPYHIKHYVNQACKIVGYDFDFDRWSITDGVWKYTK